MTMKNNKPDPKYVQRMLASGNVTLITAEEPRADGAIWVEQRQLHADEKVRAQLVGCTHATDRRDVITAIHARNGKVVSVYVEDQTPELKIELGHEGVSNNDHATAQAIKMLTADVHRNAELARQIANELVTGKIENIEDVEEILKDYGDKKAVWKLLTHSGKPPVVLQTNSDPVVIGGIPQCPMVLLGKMPFVVRARFEGHTSLRNGALRIFLRADPKSLENEKFREAFGDNLAMTC